MDSREVGFRELISGNVHWRKEFKEWIVKGQILGGGL